MGSGTFRGPALVVAAALVLVNGIGAAVVRAGQGTPPPIHGVTGTVATEETVKDVHQAGRGIFGKVARLFGGSGRASDASREVAADEETFTGLTTGAPVVVQHATES